MRFSGEELADLIGCSPSTLSVAKKRGTLVYGRWDVASWAVHDAKGSLQHYNVPDDSALLSGVTTPSSAKEAEPIAPAAAGTAALDEIETLLDRKLEEKLVRRNPVEKPDYTRPVSAGGLSYVMARAVDGDSGTARAGVLCAASLFGGLIGHEVSDHWAGALVGAVLVGGLGWQAMQSGAPAADDAPATATPTQAASASPTDTPAQGDLGRPVRAVGT
jgi:hypothetical protein